MSDYEAIAINDVLSIQNVHLTLKSGKAVKVKNQTKEQEYNTEHDLSDRELNVVLAGGLINVIRQKL